MDTNTINPVAAPVAEFIPLVDTAKMIRAALKRAFPSTKFSVRTARYSGGCSIDISFTGDLTTKEVEAVVGPFCGSGFDGMTDSRYRVNAWLAPDGSVSVAHSLGTAHMRGSAHETISDPHAAGCKLVHFHADHVFVQREF